MMPTGRRQRFAWTDPHARARPLWAQ